MSIVCRPLIIYNEFLPAEIKEERDWEYQAFGPHDGISKGNRVILDHTQEFQELFDKSAGYETEEEESYFTQVFWGIHENIEEENTFWEKEYPFIYIVLLQIAEKNLQENNLKIELYTKLNQKLNDIQHEEEEASIIFYHSLDNSDLIMVVKSKSADLGFKAINYLYHNMKEYSLKIRNTYTILGVKRTVIESADFNDIPETEQIDLLELQIIEKERGRVNLLYNILQEIIGKDKVYRKIVLGTEDDAIFIKNLSWRSILPFYKKDTGILCNSNKITQRYAYAISSKVMMKEEMDMSDDTSINNDLWKIDMFKYEDEKENNLKAPFCDKLEKEARVISKKFSLYAEKKNLLLLINALRRFEYSLNQEQLRPFSDYNFFPLFLPFYRFIELSKEEREKQVFTKHYYHFMKCMKLCTQNFAKPERIYSQITDFNMRYFDIPIKLVTLYNAYIYSIKKTLNLNLIQSYEFLICTGLNDNTEVKELFLHVSDTKRLFLIETPERQMYHIKLMFFVLGHEVAHFVGREIRNREDREEHIFKICSRIVSLSMKSYYEYGENLSEQFFNDTEWNNLEVKLKDWIKFYIERPKKREYVEKFELYDTAKSEEIITNSVKLNNQYISHSDILQVNLIDAVKDMMINRGQEILSFVIKEQYDEKISNSDKTEKWESFYRNKRENLREYINAFLGISVNPNTSLTISMAIEGIVFWLKECYADIICILLLRISLKDYIEYFITMSDSKNQNMDDLSRKDLIIRIAIVMAVMNYPLKNDSDSEKCFSWTDEEYKNITEWSEGTRTLEKAARYFCYNYIRNEKVFQKGELIKNPREIFCDQKILKEIMRYLVDCKQRFFNKIENVEENEKHKMENLKQVRRFYELSKMEDANDFFKEMTTLLVWYEDNIYNEISQLIKDA